MGGDPIDLGGPVVIIGGGPTGLGAAHRLQGSGFEEWVLFEREETFGGLAKSFVDEKGFTWGLGGHVVFSHYDVFTELLDGTLDPSGWIEHERESWIRLLDTWVPYPFQNNIHRLPPQERVRCLEELIRAALNRRSDPFADFDDFIVRTFGLGIADLFMRPYNSKAWAYPPSKLGAEWIGDRVSVPDPIRVARNVALGRDDRGWGPNNTFRFPRSGGTGAIWSSLARTLPQEKLITGCAIAEVDPEAKVVTLSSGEKREYGTLMSTMPLNELARACGRADWVEASSGLAYSSVHVVGVGLNGGPSPNLESTCWMYFPEEAFPFHKVTHFSHYSHENVPDIRAQWSLMCEVSESAERPVDGSIVEERCVDGLVAAGLIEGRGAVSHTWHRSARYAYPTPTRGRDRIISSLLPEMLRYNILSRGRFGAWRYEVGNMDHSFMQGYEAADLILHATPEVTLWNPDAVNR